MWSSQTVNEFDPKAAAWRKRTTGSDIIVGRIAALILDRDVEGRANTIIVREEANEEPYNTNWNGSMFCRYLERIGSPSNPKNMPVAVPYTLYTRAFSAQMSHAAFKEDSLNQSSQHANVPRERITRPIMTRDMLN